MWLTCWVEGVLSLVQTWIPRSGGGAAMGPASTLLLAKKEPLESAPGQSCLFRRHILSLISLI